VKNGQGAIESGQGKLIDAEEVFLLRDQFVADHRASIPSPDAASCLTARCETVALDMAHAIGLAVFSVASSCHTTQKVVEIRVITTPIRAIPLIKK
jgi:hypothetical protein